MIVVKRNGLNDKWARIIGVPLIAMAIISFSNDSLANVTVGLLFIKIFKNVCYITFYWECNRMIFIYMRNKYPHLGDTGKRLGWQMVIFLVFILVAALLIALINHIFPLGDKETFFSEYLNAVVKSMVLLGLVTICYECVYFFGRWEKSLYESERLKKENLIAQLELLKNQISPHFLFNSLNTLITLVPPESTLPVLFIQKLSNVYRHVLNYNEKSVVDLDTELTFLDDYIFLNKMRFGENLRIVYQLPPSLAHMKVIPFTLQMLVENAIKHNIVSSKKPLTITISGHEDFIVITNNLQIKTSGVESTGTGLQNITNRYQLLTNKIIDIVSDNVNFSVSLPLIYDNDPI